jgi:hypothetical protein
MFAVPFTVDPSPALSDAMLSNSRFERRSQLFIVIYAVPVRAKSLLANVAGRSCEWR